MSVTRGGRMKGKLFRWHFDENARKVRIENEDGREHSYSVQEIQAVLNAIKREFKTGYFPLANNVERLSNGTEKMGLGKTILKLEGRYRLESQGAIWNGSA